MNLSCLNGGIACELRAVQAAGDGSEHRWLQLGLLCLCKDGKLLQVFVQGKNLCGIRHFSHLQLEIDP